MTIRVALRIPSLALMILPLATLFCAIAGTTSKQNRLKKHTLSKFLSFMNLDIVKIVDCLILSVLGYITNLPNPSCC